MAEELLDWMAADLLLLLCAAISAELQWGKNNGHKNVTVLDKSLAPVFLCSPG